VSTPRLSIGTFYCVPACRVVFAAPLVNVQSLVEFQPQSNTPCWRSLHKTTSSSRVSKCKRILIRTQVQAGTREQHSEITKSRKIHRAKYGQSGQRSAGRHVWQCALDGCAILFGYISAGEHSTRPAGDQKVVIICLMDAGPCRPSCRSSVACATSGIR